MMKFDNTFINELPGDVEVQNYTRQVLNSCWSKVMPTPVSDPKLLVYSKDVADMLDLTSEEINGVEMLHALSGNGLIQGMVPYATCYGGHQFGHWAGQLGDGRAIYLGEAVNASGQRYELQLKGAGPTPYSRRADGRAVLRSSIREFLCSEAMFYLGVPTTRALSLVGTGDFVIRDMFYDGNAKEELGAIVCRVAPSFTRFGHFEIFASRGDDETLKKIITFTIKRDFPELVVKPYFELEPDLILKWFQEVCDRTAIMVAQWMRVGFVHGVMNTDNMSILGLTIDYGPYGWVDNFDPLWTPNTTDLPNKRYCFGRQPEIAKWNLSRLASALLNLMPNSEGLELVLTSYDQVYNKEITKIFAGKFGFVKWQEGDDSIVNTCFELMAQSEVDMTLFFTLLAEIDFQKPNISSLKPAFYSEKKYHKNEADFASWLQKYANRVISDNENQETRISRMFSFNPRYVLRNYLAQEAIELAEDGDLSRVNELLTLLRNPYQKQVGKEKFELKRPDWAKQKAGCSMLSCSS